MALDVPRKHLGNKGGGDRDGEKRDYSEKLYQQLKERMAEIWPVLMMIAEASARRGWSLYIVGGAVRDLLLNRVGNDRAGSKVENSLPLTDIDLVVENQVNTADETAVGAGVILAEAIQAEYPEIEAQVHGQFQTATLTWQSWQIDIATARTEFYAYPAANPAVEPSDIYRDLYRRDFTINAIALKLTGSQPGQLLDIFNGQADLQQRLVRVLHTDSFIEDPTRIFRAVRFAVRLGFDLEAQTQQLARSAVKSGIYEKSRSKYKKVPALQSRLQAELKYLLEESGWEQSLVWLDELGALACLDENLALSPGLLQQLRRMDRWVHKFEVSQPRWILLLELMLAQLGPERCNRVANSLNLSAQSQYRLRNIHACETQLKSQLKAQVHGSALSRSKVYKIFQSHSHAELLLMADRHPRILGASIWLYLTDLALISPLINGGTLKRLGYSPGPQFKKILADVHQQQLDGTLTTEESAEQYVLSQYSL
ncbi:tRNA nucleotidyltransferase/poly(A) polymerase family protein [Synechococcus sp. PCC 7335]|uniref:CCA tRNA nucleotidyltransferase n=1 Tax=Synechococcus sp. (strain ATCC 29403 / PCC 7335) TaxID=91464 RepID=UPI00017EB075|nr:CCA tRNA nucleotidyltransferase [Synechococcus sp. PCC 7335]EDX86656.1 tRNA nucleotidyltransferase/poly(A) polymerase family protein [Synechococcus sp. PCC 7335]